MSTVIINGIEYVPAKTVTGTRAAAEPVDVRHLDRSFRFDPDAQQHIPTLLVEFEPVSAVGGGDPKAKGWRDRDLLAMMLQGQPTAHIAPAEQPQPEPSADVRLLREMFALCEAAEDECADTDDSFKRGRAFEAKRIRRGIGTWYQDTFCGPTHMGEPVLCAAPEPSEAQDAARAAAFDDAIALALQHAQAAKRTDDAASSLRLLVTKLRARAEGDGEGGR